MGRSRDANCSIISSVYGWSAQVPRYLILQMTHLNVMVRDGYILNRDTLVSEQGKQLY